TFRNYDASAFSDEQAAVLRNDVWWGGCADCVQRISKPDTTVVYSKERDGRMTAFRLVPGAYIVRYAYRHPRYCHGRTYVAAERPGRPASRMWRPTDIIFGAVAPSAYSTSKASRKYVKKSSPVLKPCGMPNFMSLLSSV